MNTWEYRLDICPFDNQHILTALGAAGGEGWELVSVQPTMAMVGTSSGIMSAAPPQPAMMLILKRPKLSLEESPQLAAAMKLALPRG